MGFLPFYCFIFWAILNSIESGHSKDPDKPFILHDELDISLIANEPDVVDPVALAFDHDCQLYVVEMRDYPNGVPKKIREVQLSCLVTLIGMASMTR